MLKKLRKSVFLASIFTLLAIVIAVVPPSNSLEWTPITSLFHSPAIAQSSIAGTIFRREGSAWRTLPGRAFSVAIGGGNSTWVIGGGQVPGGFSIHRWSGSAWQLVDGGAVDIAVAPNGQPWVINNQGHIFSRANNAWRLMPGLARDIDVGQNGSVWVIGWGQVPGGFSIHRWNSTSHSWQQVDGGAVRIAVAPNGQPWVVNNAGHIFRRVNNTWQRMPGLARDIAIGYDGSVWVIGSGQVPGGFSIHRWTGSAWQRVDGGAVRIAVNNSGNPWVVNNVPPSTGYYRELSSLTEDQWDEQSGDNTQFEQFPFGGGGDQRGKTDDRIRQIYTDLSNATLGARFAMTAGYLYDASYRAGLGKWHAGIDFGAPRQTPIRAAIGGTVAWIDGIGDGYVFVGINSDDGRQWVYGHLESRTGLSVGKRFNTGDQIGIIGLYNNAPHLHLEVRTSPEGTGGAHTDQAFLRRVTMSPLQAYWGVRNR